jgi:DNA primase
MAKAYIDIVKYIVEARFDINGPVEKPDIIGAVFGQTEGLLGGSLDLRELQKNGKIGRIEITTSSSGSKTYGKLFLPSSLGRVETCILGAAIESVDRVGPFETGFKVEKIEDTRNEKRKKIINRAKELVKTLLNTEIPDSREISELVENDVKASIIGTYGSESLPAGPDIAKSEDVVIVEGRADVINLLKNDIANCIAIGGASGVVPKTIIDLCAAKETTMFIDGDRGGEMIVKNLFGKAEVDYIAKAPDGKEVEELTRKEIIKALRSKIPIEQFMQHNNRAREQRQQRDQRGDRDQRRFQRPEEQSEQKTQRQYPIGKEDSESKLLSPSMIIDNVRKGSEETNRRGEVRGAEAAELDIEGIEEGKYGKEGIESIPKIEQAATAKPGFPNSTFVESLTELHNTLRGRLYEGNGTLIKEVPIRELIQSIQDSKNVYSVVFDGIITQRLIELAYRQGVKEIYGIRASQISRTYSDLNVYTAENGPIS